MNKDVQEKIVNILTENIPSNISDKDRQNISYLCEWIKNIKITNLDMHKLESMRQILIDLELQYDEFNELSYYFDPLYVKIKRTIHKKNVEELRKENKKQIHRQQFKI